jgi:hypothetical protein
VDVETEARLGIGVLRQERDTNAEVRGIPIPRSAVQGERDADTKREVRPIRGDKGCRC